VIAELVNALTEKNARLEKEMRPQPIIRHRREKPVGELMRRVVPVGSAKTIITGRTRKLIVPGKMKYSVSLVAKMANVSQILVKMLNVLINAQEIQENIMVFVLAVSVNIQNYSVSRVAKTALVKT
jgi:hypothetical protein